MEFTEDAVQKRIIKTALVGIAMNLALGGAKIALAIASNSLALISDATNNIADSCSNLIAILGTKLAAKMPDENHPYGYGRAEYIGGLVVSVFVLALGIEFLRASFGRIFAPEETTFSPFMLAFLLLAILCKFALVQLYKKTSKETNSTTLKAISKEALGDVVISCVILASAFANLLFGVLIDAYVGVLASLFIIANGVLLIKETFDKIIGQRVEKDVSETIYAAINECPLVRASYDLILHNYGSGRFTGSVNVEVDEHVRLSTVTQTLNKLQVDIYSRFRVYLVFGIYAVNLGQLDTKACVWRSIADIKGVQSMHGFFIDPREKTMRFDVIVDFKERDIESLRGRILEAVLEKFDKYEIFVVIDKEFV